MTRGSYFRGEKGRKKKGGGGGGGGRRENKRVAGGEIMENFNRLKQLRQIFRHKAHNHNVGKKVSIKKR